MKIPRLLIHLGPLGVLALVLAPAQEINPPPPTPGINASIRESNHPTGGVATMKPVPPFQAVILSAEYELALADNAAQLDARYRILSVSPQWTLVPLLGGDARLDQVRTKPSEILWQDGSYQLLTKESGEHEVQMQFALSNPATWLHGLRLVPGSAALNRLRITGIPAGKSIRIDELNPTESAAGEQTYHIPGDHGELVLVLEPFRAPEVVAAPEPPRPSTWTLQSEVFVRFQEGRLLYESRIHCQANEGSGLEMDLLVPGNALDVTLTGDDLADSELSRRENGSRRFHVQWLTPEVLDRVVQLSYALPQSPLANTWTLTAPRVLQEGATRSLFAIRAVEGLELTSEALRGSVQSRRLPEWLRTRIGPDEFLTAESTTDLELQTNWLPRLETAQATVQSASYESRLVPDGALLVTAKYVISHQAPLAWRLELPDVEEILSCEVNAQSSQPVKRADNMIEFALGVPGENGSTVSLCYATRLEALDRVSGRCDLKLPRTDLFIHVLTWSLALPDDYVTTAIEGNLTIDRRPLEPGQRASPESVLRLRKELVRGEHPALELYYQRRGLDD